MMAWTFLGELPLQPLCRVSTLPIVTSCLLVASIDERKEASPNANGTLLSTAFGLFGMATESS